MLQKENAAYCKIESCLCVVCRPQRAPSSGFLSLSRGCQEGTLRETIQSLQLLQNSSSDQLRLEPHASSDGGGGYRHGEVTRAFLERWSLGLRFDRNVGLER